MAFRKEADVKKDCLGNNMLDLAAQYSACLNAPYTEASNMPSAFDEMREIRDRERIDALNRKRASVDAIEATVIYTPEGGIASSGMLGMLNRSRGIETSDKGDVDGQIVEAGYNPKTGGYGFMIARKNPDGSMKYEPNEIPASEVYGMVMRHPEIEGSAAFVERLKQSMRARDRSLTDASFDRMAKEYAAQRKALDDEIERTAFALRGERRGRSE